jgi:hypothetical protein
MAIAREPGNRVSGKAGGGKFLGLGWETRFRSAGEFMVIVQRCTITQRILSR